jgi:hypothetical protein
VHEEKWWNSEHHGVSSTVDANLDCAGFTVEALRFREHNPGGSALT